MFTTAYTWYASLFWRSFDFFLDGHQPTYVLSKMSREKNTTSTVFFRLISCKLQYLSTRARLRPANPPTSFRLILVHLFPLPLLLFLVQLSQTLTSTSVIPETYSTIRLIRVSAASHRIFRLCLHCVQGTTKSTNSCSEGIS